MAEYRGWGNKKSPCLNCQNRAIGCHSSCVRYKTYDEINKTNRAIKTKNYEADFDFKKVICKSTYKNFY